MEIRNTTAEDRSMVRWLFKEAMTLQGVRGHKVWSVLDQEGLERDLQNGLQYKIVDRNDVVGVFSIQYSDPHIWGDRDQGDAIYLHRIVTNPRFKGQRLFEKVLDWVKAHAMGHGRAFVRMDTWADNARLIAYYRFFGFELAGHHRTDDNPELPVQNRNLEVALLEMKVAR